MNRNWQGYTLIVVVMTMLLVGYVGAQNTTKTRKGKAVSVAVVDVKKLFDSLDEKTQIENNMKSQQQKLNAEMATKQQAIEKLKTEMGVLPKGTPAYVKKSDELEYKSIELQAWASFHRRKVERINVIQTEGLYRNMSRAIEQYAKANKVDLVFYKERPVSLVGVKPAQVSAVLQSRKVVYASDELDITDLLIQKMNNDYSNKK